MASFITKESEMISQLRLKLSDLQLKDKFNTDHFLLRWIRAGKHNLILAEKIFREHMTWREENDMDNILSWTPPEILLTSCPIKFLGYDKDNSPVRLISMGKWDLKKIVELGERSNYFKYMDQLGESLFNRMDGKFTRSGDPVTQFVSIVDHKGLSFRTSANFGGNAVFAAIFSLAKPLMSKATLDKLQIFSSNESKWKPALLTHVPASILPPSLGGIGDEFGEEASDSAPSQDQSDEAEEALGFLEVNVPVGDKLDICFTVEEVNSTIIWAFKTEKHDIVFAVNCDGKAYIEKNRVDSHESLQEGTITCETPGDYIFTFDNSYRLGVKVLTYKIEVRKPDGSKYSSF